MPEQEFARFPVASHYREISFLVKTLSVFSRREINTPVAVFWYPTSAIYFAVYNFSCGEKESYFKEIRSTIIKRDIWVTYKPICENMNTIHENEENDQVQLWCSEFYDIMKTM